MTDKLHCPFCGVELDKQIYLDEHYACQNTENCQFSFMVLPKRWWQALIDGKKAQDALKVATDFIGFVNTSRHADGALAAMAICKLNEITSITKGETKQEK